MTGKLDKSLDEILSSSRAGGRARRSTRRGAGGRPAASAPVGGVQKTTKLARNANIKNTPAKAAGGSHESKIMISNLPKDVAENMIKDYFQNTVGPVKKTEISYGPNGQSRGQAFVTFSRPDGASKAFQSLNGLLVDNRPIKIDIIVGNADAEKIIPTVKTLADRVTKPKPQPKSAASDKHGANAEKAGANKKKAGPRRARNARPTKKSKEELDADMADYFVAAPADNAAGNAPAPANGDAAMDDGIM
ncbi:hypothetical protein MKZ38_006409 [Zalerion maritima]|uniref:RRM domain-containing protein n=1 Tax=Zalerion maritima TaxID=339359 RepID=A0AAD5RJI0_9PEZI|nr:hypothetical protein MKZ38_006409 [Zalerion maritima]